MPDSTYLKWPVLKCPSLAGFGCPLTTGWNVEVEELKRVGRRVVNMMRIYSLKVGLKPDMEKPSPRYGSQPADGPNKDKAIAPHWEYIMERYYQLMGWDRKTGMPLPETLKELGLEHFAEI